jgi:ketosteroid isomerase-like protein
MNKKNARMLAGWLLSLAGLLSGAPLAYAESEFDAQLAKHFKAVQNRDLETLKSTLTGGTQLELILPSGNRTTTKAEFVAFHVEWFASKTWTMRFDPVSRIETADMAIATVRTHYEDVDDGKPIVTENWLTLTFRKEQGRWGLVHDQNTRALSR